jgi:hypothetical protein
MKHIKRIVPLLFLCGWTALTPASAQGVKFGISVEPAITWLKADVPYISTAKIRAGFNVGLNADFYFAENYALATGASLLMTGGTLHYLHDTHLSVNGAVNGDSDVKYKLQYLRIPAGLKLRTHRIGRFRYYADVGFDPLVRLSAKADYTDVALQPVENANIKQNIHLFALGYHLGGGVKYPLGGNAALVGGITFMKVFTDIASGNNDNRITANHVLLRLGISF